MDRFVLVKDGKVVAAGSKACMESEQLIIVRKLLAKVPVLKWAS